MAAHRGGGLAFSKQFLPVVGQELGADGTPYGQIHKTFGLFPFITLAQYHVLWYGRTDPSPSSLTAGTYAGDEEGVDEIASAWDPKGSNLQIQVAVNPSLAQPVFRKRWLDIELKQQ